MREPAKAERPPRSEAPKRPVPLDWVKAVAGLFVIIAVFRLIGSAVLPVIQDEAYYFYWARHLDLGYFDHPPLVSWLATTGLLVPGSAFWARLGSVVMALAVFPLSLSLFRVAGLSRPASLVIAVLLLNFNLCGLIFGFLVAPDVPLLFAWTLALHEAAHALKDNPRRWLTAGLATGIGLWGKYVMTLIGPVFLWALLRKRGGLKSPWPYAGGLMCLLTFAPHLAWNQSHDWVTFRFQQGRGFSSDYAIDTKMATPFKGPVPRVVGSPEDRIGRYFTLPKKQEEPKREPSWLEQKVANVGNFLGGQLVLWGLMLVPLGWGLVRRWRRPREEKRAATGLDPSVTPLLEASVWVPLAVFGLVGINQHIEANWPAVYLVGASVLIAARWPVSLKGVATAAAVNLVLVTGVLAHAHWPMGAKKPDKDRVLYETHGFEELAEKVAHLDAPVFADTYQLTSMLAFYQPSLAVAQWPGLARYSELTRRASMNPHQPETLQRAGHFWLVTTLDRPPHLEGYEAQTATEVRDCLAGGFELNEAFAAPFYQEGCKKAVHRWFIVRYAPSPPNYSERP